MTDEQKARAASELREVDVEFENASLAMMRAFEAFQRYEGVLEDAEVDLMPPEGRRYDAKHDVACQLHYVLRCIATRPTGGGAARAVARQAGRVRDRTRGQRRQGAPADAGSGDRRVEQSDRRA